MTTGRPMNSILPYTLRYDSEVKQSKQIRGWKISRKMWAIVVLFCTMNYGSYAVLIHLTKKENGIPYSSVSVVLLIESFKIIFSLIVYGLQRDYSGLRSLSLYRSLPFAIPALLYFINNNLGMLMQMHMDAITSQILSNLKIVSTAVFFRIIIKRSLTPLQWCAIILLTAAGVCHSYGGYVAMDTNLNTQLYITLTGILMMMTYCSLSGLAGVYSEYILKRHSQMSLHLQNMMLYTYGILFNLVTCLVQMSRTYDTDYKKGFFSGFSYITWILIFTQAANGLTMSVIMKHASNILRLFVIACSMMVTTVLSVSFLHTELNVYFFISFLFVTGALYLYNKT